MDRYQSLAGAEVDSVLFPRGGSRLDYPLKQLWSDLGFSSSSTFYKLFQQSVGITPSVYRRQFLKIEEEQRNLDEKE